MNTNTTKNPSLGQQGNVHPKESGVPVTQAASAGLPAQGEVQPAADRPDVIHNPAGRPVGKADAVGVTTMPGELYNARTGDLIAAGVKPGEAPRILRYDAPGTYTGSGYEPANKEEKTKIHEPVDPVTHHVPHHHAGSVPHHELKKEEKPIEREHRPSDISGRHQGLAKEKPIVQSQQQPHISRTDEGPHPAQAGRLPGDLETHVSPPSETKPHLGVHQLQEGNLADVSKHQGSEAGLQREGGFGSAQAQPGIEKEKLSSGLQREDANREHVVG